MKAPNRNPNPSPTRRRCEWWLGLIGLSLIASGVAGAQTQAPIELSADRAEVEDSNGVSRYFGNVILTRGPMRLTGEVMRVYTNAERELERVEIDGSPATYREHQPEAATRQAEAPRMEYYASGPERIVLLEGGHLWQGDNSVRGETITHYPAQARTVADGNNETQQRVNVTVYPQSDEGQ